MEVVVMLLFAGLVGLIMLWEFIKLYKNESNTLLKGILTFEIIGDIGLTAYAFSGGIKILIEILM